MIWSRCCVCDAIIVGDVYRLHDNSFCLSCRQDVSDSDDEMFHPNKWTKALSTSSSSKVEIIMWAGLETFRHVSRAIFWGLAASGHSYTSQFVFSPSDPDAPC